MKDRSPRRADNPLREGIVGIAWVALVSLGFAVIAFAIAAIVGWLA